MKTQRTARKAAWITLAAAFVLAGIFLIHASAATTAGHGNLGQALALRALSPSKAFFQGVADAGEFDPRHNAQGRFVFQPSDLFAARANPRATNSPITVTEPVQTFDIFAPAPNFDPVSSTGLVTVNGGPGALTPTNLTPIWTPDQQYIIYSSNRDLNNPLQVAADGHFHIWASVATGSFPPFPITTGPGNESFPALASNNDLAFVSTAIPGNTTRQSPTHSLYTLNLNLPTGGTRLGAGLAPVNVATITQALETGPGTGSFKTFGDAGFDDVERPTWAPVQNDRIVFTARTAIDPNSAYVGHYHLYYLYVNTNGYQGNGAANPGTNPPALLTDGPADDTDPAWEPAGSGDYIAFASTASNILNNPNGNTGNGPGLFNTLTVAPAGTSRSIFVLNASFNKGFGTTPSQGGRITKAGTDDFGPAWSLPTVNQYVNPSGLFEYLAWSRGASVAAPHDVYYMRTITNVSSSTPPLFPEGTLNGFFNGSFAGDKNTPVKLNTDNGAGTYSNIYPTWSPFLSVFSIAYASNRSVTYNDPASAQAPVETAISLAQNTNNVGPAYTGILQSQVLNLDPPTLLRYSGGPSGEVIHVNAGTTPNLTSTPARVFSPGSNVTFTVRLSNREAGISNNGMNGQPDVYIQIKDPDSRYQDSQNLEHKLFARNDWYWTERSTDTPANFYNFSHAGGGTILHPRPDSGSSTLMTLENYPNQQNGGFNNTNSAVGFNTKPAETPAVKYRQIGAIGGFDRNLPGNVAGSISVGTDGGGTNQIPAYDTTATPPRQFVDPTTGQPVFVPAQVLGSEGANYNGGDWKQFVPWGPEYECEYVNPTTTADPSNPHDPGTAPVNNRSSFAIGYDPTNPAAGGDFGVPFYLAGYDDQGSFSGYEVQASDTAQPVNINLISQFDAHPPRPTATGATAQWLQLQKAPQQDNLGGVLYTVTWKTPGAFRQNQASDFFLDVIAYDNARFPDLPQDVSSYASLRRVTEDRNGNYGGFSNRPGKDDNWRIYDNIWGFTTQASVASSKDILVVSDYALGQKFGLGTFGGQTGASNLPPKVFGAESYVTDIDERVLPNRVFYNYNETGATVAIPQNTTPPTSITYTATFPTTAAPTGGNPEWPIVQQMDQITGNNAIDTGGPILNGLGVGSYTDITVLQTGTTDPAGDGFPYPRSQQYAIWRTLARGTLDPAVLRGYQPNSLNQPAVNDTQRNFTDTGGLTLDAHTCVIWVSPFTNALLAGPGTLADSATQAELQSFVNAGGRLCVTGEDVGSGTNNSFLSSVLNATLKSAAGGTQTLTGADKRISGNGQNNNTHGNVTAFFPTFSDRAIPFNFTYGYTNPDQPLATLDPVPLLLSNSAGPGGNGRLDASLDQFGPAVNGIIPAIYGPNSIIIGGDFLSQIDTLTPGAGAVTDVTNTDPGLIYTENLTNGSRVVYSAFGLEGISTEYYAFITNTNGGAPPTYGAKETWHFAPRNSRQNILHNVVDYLRTGTVSGKVITTANGSTGGGQPVANATVYLVPANGTVLTGNRKTFSSRSDANGLYSIGGVDPGDYLVAAYKAGYLSAISATYVTVEGDTTAQEQALDIEPVPPATITGTVTDATTGATLSSASVTFTSTTDPNLTTTVTTDANGNYSVTLAPGSYNATAVKAPAYGSAGPAAPITNPITLTSGQNLPGVNFKLGPAPSAITGIVTDTAGNPLAGVTVTAKSGTTTKNADQLTDASGSYTISGLVAALSPYTLTAAKVNYFQNSAPPSVPVSPGVTTTAPTIQLTAATNVTLSGTVRSAAGAPLPGATVTIANLDGTAAAFTVTTGTAGANGVVTTDAGGNYAVTILQGSYNLTASAARYTPSGPTGGNPILVITNPTTVNFSLALTPAAAIFPAGRYSMFSLPFEETLASFSSIFGTVRNVQNPSGNRGPLQIYQSTAGTYVAEPTAPADGIHVGRGYFVYLVNSVSLLQTSVGASPTGTVSVPLQGGSGLDGWNMIGVPSTTPINVTSLSFKFGNGLVASFDQAVNSLRVISPTLYGYNPATFSYTPITQSGQLQPYQGYWIHTNVAGLTIQIPGGGTAPAARKR